MRKLKLILLPAVVILIILSAGAIFVAEWTLHLPVKAITHKAEHSALLIAKKHHAKIRQVELRTEDGVVLHGWFFEAEPSTRKSILLVHGQGDNRAGMLRYANLFLQHHFCVLLPDMRAHGSNGANLATYGIREKYDIHRWISWLADQPHVQEIYGLGESMGAAILLQSLETENRFRGVIAESSFCNFNDVARDRIAEFNFIGKALSKTHCLQPFLELTYAYAHFRYRIDLKSISPELAVAATHTPVLLIHGMNDTSILPSHSERILKQRSDSISIWRATRTRHSHAFGQHPEEFERRVIAFCNTN
jgi:dipeptidyl aminopeptidase/acylaminoacyl peptidase